MKQVQSTAKRGSVNIGLCAVLCVLLLMVAGIFFGTSMGTGTNAKALTTDLFEVPNNLEKTFETTVDTIPYNMSGADTSEKDLNINEWVSDIRSAAAFEYFITCQFGSITSGSFSISFFQGGKGQMDRDALRIESGYLMPDNPSAMAVQFSIVMGANDYMPWGETLLQYSSSVDKIHIHVTNDSVSFYATYFGWDTPQFLTTLTDYSEYTPYERFIMLGDFSFGGFSAVSGSCKFLGLTETLRLYQERPVGPEVPLPDDPVKQGHTFVGWYYDQDFTRPYDGAPIYQNTNLYAKFEINTYTVTYVADCDPIDPVTLEWNTAAPTPQLKRMGYNFVGWFKDDGTKYNGEGITDNTTLTARFEIKKFTVTFYIDSEMYTALEVEYGTSLKHAMVQADVVNYRALDMDGVRVSLQSTITEDTQVLIHELSGWEKYGNFVARNHWYTWLTVGVLCVLLSLAVVGIVELVKKGK